MILLCFFILLVMLLLLVSVVFRSVHEINHVVVDVVVVGDIVVVFNVVGDVVATGVGGVSQCARNKSCCCR